MPASRLEREVFSSLCLPGAVPILVWLCWSCTATVGLLQPRDPKKVTGNGDGVSGMDVRGLCFSSLVFGASFEAVCGPWSL